ncbi:MAG: arylesterase [Acidobacteriaceae bacterium]
MNRRVPLILLLVLVAALVPFPAHAAKRPVIVCYGDSITAGHGLIPSQAWPAALQHDLNTRGYHYRVINAGVSGNTTKDGVDRLPLILAMHPAVVVVEFGGNDGLRGLPLAVTKRNLEVIVSRLLAAHAKVVLAGITLPPNYGEAYIHQFDLMYHQVAARYHVPLLPMLYAHIYTVPGAIQSDGIHPTAKGSRLLAKAFLPLLLPLLRK